MPNFGRAACSDCQVPLFALCALTELDHVRPVLLVNLLPQVILLVLPLLGDSPNTFT